MEELTLKKAHVMAKRLYVLLVEVQDLSQQLAQALDRNDEVTARMLISMRSEPIGKARQTKEALRALKEDLPPPDAARLAALLNGAVPETEAEQALAKQLKSNDTLLQQVLTLDENLNRKIAREKSIYQK